MVETIVNTVICVGRLLGHLRGAWRCTCEIAVILDAAIEPTPGLDAGSDL